MKDAYYSVPIAISHGKYVRFSWRGQLYQFTCLPNGLSCGPRKFTKLLKPAITKLHLRGHISSGYIDDLYLQGKTYHDCVHIVIDTVIQIDTLGLVTHPAKSAFIPSQQLVILGFVLNSVTMTITLTQEKALALQTGCTTLLNTAFPSIREVAPVLSIAIDAFTINWAKLKFYAFPPFSVIAAVLKTILEDKATGVCVLPNWPTQAWFPKAMRMTVQEPVVLKASKTLLHFPNQPTALHPLHKKLTLLVCHLSGNT